MDKERAKELEVYANRLLAENLRRDRLAKDEKKRAKLELLKEHEVASEAEKGGEMLAALRQLPLLNDISDQDVQDVLGGQVVLSNFQAGEYIFKTGDSPEFMYLIVEGQMKILFNSIDGEELIFIFTKTGGTSWAGITFCRECRIATSAKHSRTARWWPSPGAPLINTSLIPPWFYAVF